MLTRGRGRELVERSKHTWFMHCIHAPRIMRRTTPEGPLPVSSCHQVYVSPRSLSMMSLIMAYWVRTEGLSTVAPWPSRAARISSASSCRSFRISRRGESGRKGHIKQMRMEKTASLVSRAQRSHGRTGDALTYLEGQGESPTDASGGEGEAESQPVGD